MIYESMRVASSRELSCSVSPAGVIEIETGDEITYAEAINVTCTEKQLGGKSLERDEN